MPLLTGLAMVLMQVLDVHLGFSFSAGLFDYVPELQSVDESVAAHSHRAQMYFGLYYGVFRFVIRRFDLKTPGRDIDDVVEEQTAGAAGDASRARGFIQALGGASNLVTVDACTTRLRLVVANQSAVNLDALKRLGARGVVRPSADALQVVLGPVADQVAGDIRAALACWEFFASAGCGGSCQKAARRRGGAANLRGVFLLNPRGCEWH